MTQDERWLIKWHETIDFLQTNRRNPSRYDPEERGRYYNWIKHNKKLLNAGDLKPERIEMFKQLLILVEQFKHVNQYQ